MCNCWLRWPTIFATKNRFSKYCSNYFQALAVHTPQPTNQKKIEAKPTMNKIVFLAALLLLAAMITCDEQVQTKYDEETLNFKAAKNSIWKLVKSVKDEFAKNHYGKMISNLKIVGGSKTLKTKKDEIAPELKELEHFALDSKIQKENLIQDPSKRTEFETLALKIDAEIKEPIEKKIKQIKEPKEEQENVLENMTLMSSLLDTEDVVLEKEGDEQLEKKEAKVLAREADFDKKKEKKGTKKTEREVEEKGMEEEKTLDAQVLGVTEEAEGTLANEEEVLNGVMKHFSGFEHGIKNELVSLLKSMGKGIKVQQVQTEQAETLEKATGIQDTLKRLFKEN